ncbi:MAG: GDP-4-dehydro-6-deoxy-D-mannose reductase [Candidatus Binatota bacterium]|jgi:GDP-4-dehydro-6-deoxy-D-mannose reductase|nr:GDP-4-dehydro-6-deoxy-D-mannose reductase [Candidatus Binatota bacterium]
MRFFVTGISGFAGGHLAAALLEAGHSVSGIARNVRVRAIERLHERYPGRFPVDAVRACDVRDGLQLREALRRFRPDGIFHLAGIAFVPRSFAEPRVAYQVNLFGALELLEAAREAAAEARVILVTSGEVYGWIDPGELPLREEQPLRPITPYAIGKAAADFAGFQVYWAEGRPVIRARPFNHTGPGQSPDFVCSEFARAIAAAEAGLGPTTLRVGDLDVERDFSDVRDVVRGYLALFERGEPGEAYNLGSGTARSIRSVLDGLIARSTVPMRIEADPAKQRPREIRRIVAAIDKVSAATGWRPEIPIERTLTDLLDHWREELRDAAT